MGEDPPIESDTPTDWPAFAAMLLRGDPDELRASLPDWLREIVESVDG